jgi:hypothetical protein
MLHPADEAPMGLADAASELTELLTDLSTLVAE